MVVEVAFKIKENQEQAEKILKDNGYSLFWHTQTHDLYFTKAKLTPKMTEQQIKYSCIRFRHSAGGCGFDNYKLFDNNAENRFHCDFEKAIDIMAELKENGYIVVFDTYKTDYIYNKNGTKQWHQLQNIKHIGLLDYYYNEDLEDVSEDEQFEILKSDMKKLGFTLEFDLGIDKLRSLLAQKACFSKNQEAPYVK